MHVPALDNGLRYRHDGSRGRSGMAERTPGPHAVPACPPNIPRIPSPDAGRSRNAPVGDGSPAERPRIGADPDHPGRIRAGHPAECAGDGLGWPVSEGHGPCTCLGDPCTRHRPLTGGIHGPSGEGADQQADWAVPGGDRAPANRPKAVNLGRTGATVAECCTGTAGQAAAPHGRFRGRISYGSRRMDFIFRRAEVPHAGDAVCTGMSRKWE